MNRLLNLCLAFSTRGYLLLILVGLIVFGTGLSDGLSKYLIGFGLGFYFIGPYVVHAVADYCNITPATPDDADSIWYNMLGLTYLEIISLLMLFAEIIVAITILIGAILYFTPSSNDLKSKGHSLIIRGLVLASIFASLHVIPWV